MNDHSEGEIIMSEVVEEFKLTTAFESFKYWFVRNSADLTRWNVIDRESMQLVQEAIDENALVADPEFNADFTLFQYNRPEYLVGSVIKGYDMKELPDMLDYLLTGAILCRAYRQGKNPDTAVPTSNAIIKWLHETDFYRAPASTQYHEAYVGGLLVHTMNVYNTAVELHKVNKFNEVPMDSIALVSIVHDWCKIGNYESYNRNVKNDETGTWEQVLSFRNKSINIPLGHGVTSMFLASKFFRLSAEESAAIRWHMNHWNVADNEVNDLQRANENYRMVHYIQFADQLSIVSY